MRCEHCDDESPRGYAVDAAPYAGGDRGMSALLRAGGEGGPAIILHRLGICVGRIPVRHCPTCGRELAQG